MKRIKFFLASSIEDLREDRLQVGDFFRQLNELYLDCGVHFSLIKCEDYDNSMTTGGKQQEYDREIRESELVFFLFFRKVGDYTKHEFEVALEAFKARQKPRIVTYFKYVAGIEEETREVRNFMHLLDYEFKHYYNTYGHIDTLKLGILMQIKLLRLDSAQVKLEDGVVRLNDQAVLKAENVPLLHGNRTLQELTKKRQQLQAALNQRRSAYLAAPTPENESEFFNTSAELNRVSKKLAEVEYETMVLLTTISEITSDGRVLTPRQKEALKHFNRGDYAAVQAILEVEERENELHCAQQRAEVAKNEIQGYVEEELLLIKTVKAQGLTEDRVNRIMVSYQKVMNLVELHNLEKSVLYDYASFLEKQNHHAEAIAVAEKLSWYCTNPSVTVAEEDRARLYILLGILYSDTQRHKEAEEAYDKALVVYTCMAAWTPDAYEPNVAISYNNLGILYSDTQRYVEAEKAYNKALEIRIRLAARNPDAYEPDLADIYNSLGNLYCQTQRYVEAEEAYNKALEIRIRLAARNPDTYETALAASCHNLGNLYVDINRYKDAEEAYNKALEIHIRLAARNPDAYEPDLANSYNSVGNLNMDINRYKDAEEAHRKTMEIRTRMAARNPDAYEPVLADSYNNLGVLYYDTRRYMEAEEAYNKALEICIRLTARNPDAYEPNLAFSYNNLGNLYKDTHRFDEAEKAYGQALDIRIRLSARNPDAYEPNLVTSYTSLGILYNETQRYAEAEEYFGITLEICTRMAARNPDAYEPYQAAALLNLAALYQGQGQDEKMLSFLHKAQPFYEKLARQNPDRYAENAELIRRILGNA